MKNRGTLLALSAYILWGILVGYWKWLAPVPALQLLAHRIAWSFLLLVGVLVATRRWVDFRAKLRPRVVGIYVIAALLIGANWLTYVWAVVAGYVIETSLGYFISPLLSVLLGMIFLRERVRPLQWLPILMAAGGVIYLTLDYGSLPWIALTLAFSFGFYGLVKKTAPLNSLYGLTLETGLLFLPAIGYLILVEFSGTGAFLHSGMRIDLLLVGAGVVTSVPLLLFASASRRIPLTLLGLLQYISPTLQFLFGYLVYHEPFGREQWIGYGIVWLALFIFWLESRHAQQKSPEPRSEPGEG